jgi:Flp pilus assembly protein CpaB
VAATTLTPARALRQPRRLDGRAVAGLFLTAISTFGALLFWSSASDTRAVLVATRARPAGAQLGPSDLAVARVRMEDALYRVAIPAEERAQVVGRQLADPVHAQQVLVRAQVSARPPLAPDQVAFTIPVSADTAAGLRVRPGDPVQVLATLRKGTADAQTDTVLERAVVYEVAYDDRRGPASVPAPGAEGDGIWRGGAAVPVAITLAVSRAEVNRLATARWNGNLDVVILPPEGAPRP